MTTPGDIGAKKADSAKSKKVSDRPEFVWFFDENRRVYEDRKAGVGSAPIWREHWRKINIIGETRVSWLLDSRLWIGGRHVDRIPKARPKFGYLSLRTLAYAETEIDDQAWVEEHGAKIGWRVGMERDAWTLRQIAAMIGYDPEAK